MNLLVELIRSARGTFALAIATCFVGGLGSAALVGLINHGLSARRDEVAALSLSFALLAVGVPALRWLSSVQFVKLRHYALARLRILLSTHIAHAPFAQLEGEGASRLLAVLLEDVATVSEFFVALPRFVMQGAIVIGSFAYLAWLSWQALAYALAMVLMGSLLHFWAVRRASGHLERGRLAEDELYGHFRVLSTSSKELHLSRERRAHFLDHRLAPSARTVRQHNTRGYLTYVGAGSFGAFLFFAVIGGVIFGLGSLVELERSVRSGYVLMFLYMMFPLEDLLEAVPDLLRVRISLGRIREVCGSELHGTQPLPDTIEPAPPTRIELRGVSHSYRRESEEGVFRLGPLSMSLRTGELVFLVGGNGSGKTTLAKLLVGLYQPDDGETRVDGKAVDDAGREAYRQLFSAIFSEFHVFETMLGLPPEEVTARGPVLLRELALTHKVQLRDGELSTTALSSGQRKRLALLVACLEQRPFCIFDEWAADQDPAYKEIFYRQILPALKAQGKGVLVITHDDRYFDAADRCVRLEYGQLRAFDRGLAEQGTDDSWASPPLEPSRV